MITKTTIEKFIDEEIVGNNETKDVIVVWDPAAGETARLSLWVRAEIGGNVVYQESEYMLRESSGGVAVADEMTTGWTLGSPTHGVAIGAIDDVFKVQGIYDGSQTIRFRIHSKLTILT